jgi:hypothetical protein
MAYDNPDRRTYNWLHDFGAGAEIFSLNGPTNKQGVIREIGVSVTETFACDSTAATVQVGTAADNDAYALLTITDATADEAYFNQADDTDAIIAGIPMNTLVEVNCTQSADSVAAAGQGIVTLVIDWF